MDSWQAPTSTLPVYPPWQQTDKSPCVISLGRWRTVNQGSLCPLGNPHFSFSVQLQKPETSIPLLHFIIIIIISFYVHNPGPTPSSSPSSPPYPYPSHPSTPQRGQNFPRVSHQFEAGLRRPPPHL